MGLSRQISLEPVQGSFKVRARRPMGPRSPRDAMDLAFPSRSLAMIESEDATPILQELAP